MFLCTNCLFTHELLTTASIWGSLEDHKLQDRVYRLEQELTVSLNDRNVRTDVSCEGTCIHQIFLKILNCSCSNQAHIHLHLIFQHYSSVLKAIFQEGNYVESLAPRPVDHMSS